jgi:hypothetical protein
LINFWWQRSSGDAVVSGLNPAAWFRFGQGIASAGGLVSQWNDQSGNSRHLVQATGTNQPALNANGSILFDGVDNFMKCAAFTLNQPETVYLLFRQVTWSDVLRVCDGDTLNTGAIFQNGVSPQIRAHAGLNTGLNGNLAVNAYGAVAAVFNGASSLTQVNSTAVVTGNGGASNMGGFTLGADGNGAQVTNIEVKEAILYAAAHDAATRAAVIGYLMSVGGI